ncbi:MAG: hypothetical protein IJA56_05155 [Clostridia bacterium]|nr:hypothetical protein [Clostridia bacterium]
MIVTRICRGALCDVGTQSHPRRQLLCRAQPGDTAETGDPRARSIAARCGTPQAGYDLFLSD